MTTISSIYSISYSKIKKLNNQSIQAMYEQEIDSLFQSFPEYEIYYNENTLADRI